MNTQLISYKSHNLAKRHVLIATLAMMLLSLSASQVRADCNPAADQVSFFVDAQFKGGCVTKGLSSLPNASSIGLPNDSISSVKIGEKAQALICRDNNFEGDCILLRGDVPLLTGTRVGNDMISSAKVQPRGFQDCVPSASQVSLFKHADFLGACVAKNAGSFPNSAAIGLPNDSITSVLMGDRAQAVICRDNDFKGACKAITSNVALLDKSTVGNDQVSSVRVIPREFSPSLKISVAQKANITIEGKGFIPGGQASLTLNYRDADGAFAQVGGVPPLFIALDQSGSFSHAFPLNGASVNTIMVEAIDKTTETKADAHALP